HFGQNVHVFGVCKFNTRGRGKAMMNDECGVMNGRDGHRRGGLCYLPEGLSSVLLGVLCGGKLRGVLGCVLRYDGWASPAAAPRTPRPPAPGDAMTADAPHAAVESPAAAVIVARGLTKVYHMGEVE